MSLEARVSKLEKEVATLKKLIKKLTRDEGSDDGADAPDLPSPMSQSMTELAANTKVGNMQDASAGPFGAGFMH